MNSVAHQPSSTWSRLIHRQRALASAILSGLLAFGFDAWSDALRRSESYETGDLDGLRYLEAATTVIAALALAYHAFCLLAARTDADV